MVGALARRRLSVVTVISTGRYACGWVHTPAVLGTVGTVEHIHWETGIGALDSGKGAILQALGYVDTATSGHQPVIGAVIAPLPRLVGLLKQNTKGMTVISSSGC